MANNQANTTIRNTNEPNNTLITINIAAQTPLKLTSTNYLSWKPQFQTLLIGYDLLGYVDGTKPCPPPPSQTTTTQLQILHIAFGSDKTNWYLMLSLAFFLQQ